MAALNPVCQYHQWVLVTITANSEPYQRNYWQCARCGKRKEAQP